MNKTEQAQQLRLAADIFETGHPFEVRHDTSEKWHPSRVTHPARAVLEGWHLRPILATPSDGRPMHNPSGLSAEQVGLGWRLTLKGEKPTSGAQTWMGDDHINGEWEKRDVETAPYYAGTTYRLPLSVPWPEAKPDPHAELKAAHAAGKAIKVQMPNGEWFDYKPDKPQWNLQPECYRIKPEPATKEVELGPEDVPPGSVVLSSSAGCNGTRWASVACAKTDGVEIYGRVCIPWSELFTHWKINRSIPLTGKWDANAWEPCHKTLANG